MHQRTSKFSFLLVALFLSVVAIAQTPPREPAVSVFDAISRWLTVVGEKTEDVLAPRFGRIGDTGESVWAGLTARTRDFEENYQVRPSCVVNITRVAGEGLVTVATWDNPIVRVRINAVIGAEQGDLAQKLVDELKFVVTSETERISIGADAPDMRELGKVAVKLDYEITIPATASVVCRNDWGDTVIGGVNGNVTVDSKFGAVDLRTIGGPVNVRAWGEFPLRAFALQKGGSFELQGTQSEFANVSGSLKVTNFMGSVIVRELAPEVELDVTSESGSIDLFVPENATPEISASTTFGSIQSDIELAQETRGDVATARGGSLESAQRLSLHSSFDTIRIHQEGVKPLEKPLVRNGGEFVRKNVEQSLEAPAGAEIVIKAIVGDVTITPVDTNMVSVKAAQVVQLRTNANAQAAIEALNVRCEVIDGRVMVTTAVLDNMEALGCTHYRVDLDLECPRGSPLKLTADSGFTSVRELLAPVSIQQGKGSVSIDQCTSAGAIDVALQAGDVSVANCAGALTVTAEQGSVKTAAITGKQVITASQGRLIVENPKGELVLRNRGGDISVLALDGVQGQFNIAAEKGNINVLLPDSSDATLWVTAKSGQINSRVPLTGSIERDKREFKGQLGAGLHKVEIAVDSGTVFID